jgi:hypothetical protein
MELLKTPTNRHNEDKIDIRMKSLTVMIENLPSNLIVRANIALCQ